MSYRISEVARRTGLSAKTIRFYEQIGLVPPAKRSNPSPWSLGYRAYTDADVRRLILTRRARLLNLSLAEIKRLVKAASMGCCNNAESRLRALFESKLRKTDAALRELSALRDTLASFLRRPGRFTKKKVRASDCFSDDCGFTVPIGKLEPKVREASSANGCGTVSKRRSKPKSGMHLRPVITSQ